MRAMVARFPRRDSVAAGNPPVGPAFASLIHSVWTCAGVEPTRRRRAATESQYAAFGFRITFAACPPTAQSTTSTRGLFIGSAFALGTNVWNSWVALLIPMEMKTIRPLVGSG